VYGSANLEWQIPNSPTTKFRLGSITKQFTAAAIMLLVDQGKLAVDDHIKAHMPDAPAAWDAITIYNLLTHTSGIPNFTSLPGYATWKLSPTTPEETIAHFRDLPLDFQPGQRMSYSNSGYIVLGYVIERISGQSYADFIREHIFTPLGMKDSGYDSNTAIIPMRAAGYSRSPDGPVNAPYIDMTVPFAAGGLYSTTGDLLRWTRGLFGGKLLSPKSLQAMTTPFMNDYAFGLTVRNVDGRTVFEHGGGIEGFNTDVAYYPDDETTVVALGNLNGNAPQQIVSQLGAAMHGESVTLPSERKEISLPPEALSKLTGTYELAPTANMVVSVMDGQLYAKLGPQPAVPFFPESETLFFARAVDAQIEFVKGANGEITALALHQGGVDRRAPKLAEREEVTPPADVLREYPGTYELRPGFDLVITLENGHLMSQATGQPKVEIYAESKDHFFLKVANAQIEFVRSDGGMDQAGRNTRAERR
jgi:CubicO group peptidase (beta-lactamase class C family)